jgi:hypothetical protein
MKKCMILAFTFLFVFIAAPSAFCANLYESYSKKGEVKVFVSQPENHSDKPAVKTAELKKSIETALQNRKSIRFKIVPTREEANIAIETDVVEFMWTDHDPVDMIMGVGAIAMDTAVVEDYARMTAQFKITDLKKQDVVWADKLKSTLTQKDMPESKSLDLIGDDMAKTLIKEAFAKKSTSRN